MTDTQTPHDGIGRAYALHCAEKTDWKRQWKLLQRDMVSYISVCAFILKPKMKRAF